MKGWEGGTTQTPAQYQQGGSGGNGDSNSSKDKSDKGGSGGSEDNGGNSDCEGHKQQSTQSGSGRNGGGTAAVATEIAMGVETAMVTATDTTPTPTMGHQQQQQWQCIREVPFSKRPHYCLCLPPHAATSAAQVQKCRMTTTTAAAGQLLERWKKWS
jgi:hypothetical protein